MKKTNGLVIAGTHSSVGKSSISSGLMYLLKQKGYSIKPFKVGPDYIDPGHHARACGLPSYNLDTVMCSPNYAKSLYNDIMNEGDTAIIEGVMGLHDGASSKSDKGSTAEVAKLLNLPVVLVVDGRAMARSAAAMVLGYMKLDPEVKLIGVIANHVNNECHAQIIKDAIEHHTSAKLLACLPTDPKLSIPSRHLGLHQSIEQNKNLYKKWSNHIETHINFNLFLDLFNIEKRSSCNIKKEPKRWRTKARPRTLNIAVAKDEAFQFIYQDTLDYLAHQGFNISFFSPIKDPHLPPKMDIYYFPGGYPELHAKLLSKNRSIIKDVKKAAHSGKIIIGECGGLMYLGKHITSEKGQRSPMVGLFNYSTSIKTRKLSLGYRKLKPVKKSKQNLTLKGHEFHYSTFTKNNEVPSWNNINSKHRVNDGFNKNNCYSFYTHIYWASNKNWLNHLMKTKK